MFAVEYYLCIIMEGSKTDLLQHNNLIITFRHVLRILKV
jgi:hypothetical protein